MNIVFYTSGRTGTGRLIRGLCVATALKRKGIDCTFTIISGSPFSHLAGTVGVRHVEIPLEDGTRLSRENFHRSALFSTLCSLEPHIILVDLNWFALHHMIRELPGKKIFLSRQVADRFFTLAAKDETLAFNPAQYDRIFAIEPFASAVPMERLNPFILRNHDEIFTREEAMEKLGLNAGDRHCLISHNGEPGEFRQLQKDFSYLKDAGYVPAYSTSYDDGIFPIVDYFNAFDLIVCGGGYHAFWEAVYFEKEFIPIPMPRLHENQHQRIELCKDYHFTENGADELADIIMAL
ncbi:MAG: hypothetical protein CVV44_11810 [Spirochaetae bacterium HGW-Spirochaetae-1]|jgi:hypothetical protein|nr:MAG: hypothetical protein CVV44_11810 [Spirochaetae bacterium HGW-Spirochaetae-1]